MSFENPTSQDLQYEKEAEILLPEVLDKIKSLCVGKKFTITEYTQGKDQTVVFRMPDPEQPKSVYIREDGVNHSNVTSLYSILNSPEGLRIVDDAINALDTSENVKKHLLKKILAR
jgi:hypothetical protein